MSTDSFPDGFLWGTATAAYQVEGAAHEDGRAESIWDRFSHTPGKVKNGDTGDVACDHYHLYKQDVAMMKQLGVGGYRFSVSWPRVFPQGVGFANARGMAFYDRLVDELLGAGIRPFVTLYHWDLPTALHDRGGWANRDIAGWFSDYAAAMTKALGDRVKDWITLNEPWCTAFLSYEFGEHAPGLRNPALAVQVAHHTLLAHGMGMQAIRAAGNMQTRVGIALNAGYNLPLADSEADRVAAENAVDPLYEWFVPTIFNGYYTERLFDDSKYRSPDIRPGDMAVIAARNDFLGVNYYTPTRYTVVDGQVRSVRNPNGEYTEMDWEVDPEGLYRLLLKLCAQTKNQLPLYITENGAAYPDIPAADGAIHDADRVSFLKRHFDAARRAIREGVDLRGYFVWSLMDNFEWAHGYTKNFGIVKTDYITQRRVFKDSALYFRNVCAANAVV